MAIYYEIVCTECKESIPVASTAGGWSPMQDDPSVVVVWLGRHRNHMESVLFANDSTSEYDDYDDYPHGEEDS